MKYSSHPISLLLVFLLAFSACQFPGHDLTGKYHAHNPSGKSPMILELNEDGKGSWTVGSESAIFRWEAKEGEIWLHSRTGGVIVGKLQQDNVVDVVLPGLGRFLFRRVNY